MKKLITKSYSCKKEIEYDWETARQLQNGTIDFKKVCRELIFDEHNAKNKT